MMKAAICWITGFALALLCRVVQGQQSPITLAIEFQGLDGLGDDQVAFLTSVVNASYTALRKYVLAKQPPRRLLAEHVCRTYALLPRSPAWPSSPPLRPGGPLLPPDPAAPPGSPPTPGAPFRRLAAHAAVGWQSDGAVVSDDGSGSGDAGGVAEGVGRALLQQQRLGAVLRCYPDFNVSADERLRQCGRAAIQQRHMRSAAGAAASGQGEVADLYLYVTADADDSVCPPGDDIRAATCLYDTATGRPTMSAINVCPQALDRYDTNGLVARVLREMLRALGVTRVGFFGLAPRSQYAGYVIRQQGQGQGQGQSEGAVESLEFLATPNVRQAVREFFRCGSAPGALMEGAGAAVLLQDSSVVLYEDEELVDADYNDRAQYAFTGWETTHFQGDLLIGSLDPVPAAGTSPQVTPLTLALLADTTWYAVAPDAAGYWSWGRGAGCALATRTCGQLLGGNSTYAVGGSVLLCDPAAYASGALLCAPGGATAGACTSDPVFTGPRCGLVTSPTPREPVCAARELEIAGLSGGDPTASPSFGWAAGPTSTCIPTLWPWFAYPPAPEAPPAVPTILGGNGPATPAAAGSGPIATVSLQGPLLQYPQGGAAAAQPSAGSSCFPAACSAAGALSVRVGETWLACPSGALVNVTVAGLAAGTLGPCPDNAAICGTYSGGSGAVGFPGGAVGAAGGTAGCAPGQCSARGGVCRPATEATAGGQGEGQAAGGGQGGWRCFCGAGFGGDGCTEDLVSGEVEDVAAELAATAVLEAAVVLQMTQSAMFSRRGQLLGAISDAGLTTLPLSALSVARVTPMSSFPSYVAAGGNPLDIQVVVRFLAANPGQAAAFRTATSGDLLGPALERLGFSGAASGLQYLGDAGLGLPPPPSPPPAPSPPPQPPTPPPPSPQGSRGDGGGLTGDQKVAIGVGVGVGSFLIILLCIVACCIRKHRETEEGLADQGQARQYMALSTMPPPAAAPAPAPAAATATAAAASELPTRRGLPPSEGASGAKRTGALPPAITAGGRGPAAGVGPGGRPAPLLQPSGETVGNGGGSAGGTASAAAAGTDRSAMVVAPGPASLGAVRSAVSAGGASGGDPGAGGSAAEQAGGGRQSGTSTVLIKVAD